jgi:hypothetical protein
MKAYNIVEDIYGTNLTNAWSERSERSEGKSGLLPGAGEIWKD